MARRSRKLLSAQGRSRVGNELYWGFWVFVRCDWWFIRQVILCYGHLEGTESRILLSLTCSHARTRFLRGRILCARRGVIRSGQYSCANQLVEQWNMCKFNRHVAVKHDMNSGASSIRADDPAQHGTKSRIHDAVKRNSFMINLDNKTGSYNK
jgi:hypothetical protein